MIFSLKYSEVRHTSLARTWGARMGLGRARVNGLLATLRLAVRLWARLAFYVARSPRLQPEISNTAMEHTSRELAPARRWRTNYERNKMK